MDQLSSMRVFVRVAEKGGFAAAAKEIRVSPTMVGKHIRMLEEHLGTRLVHRTTRRQSLTEAGTLYLNRARRILAELEEIDASVRRAQRKPQGVLRVVCPVTFGVQRLTPALPDYLNSHEGVRIDLTLDDGGRDLVEEGFDAAIRIGNLQDSSLIGRRLQPYRTVLAAAPEYLARKGDPKKPADLTAHNCLGFTHWDRPDSWRLVAGEKSHRVDIAGNFTVNQGFALRAAALAGLGIAMQPEALLAEDLAARRLIRVLPRFAPRPRPMHLVYLADHHMTPKLRSFVDFVVKRFG